MNQIIPHDRGNLASRLINIALTYAQTAASLSDVTAYLRTVPGFATASGRIRDLVFRRLQSWWTQSAHQLGDRNISAPVAFSTYKRVPKPRFQSTTGGVVIRHREYLADVKGSVGFGVRSWTIQPGEASTFPWLSSIANNFEQYQFRSLKFSYVNVAATNERGRITMAFDRDPLDLDPSAKFELFQYAGAVEGSVWTRLEHTVQSTKKLFTRSGVIQGSDLKTYDAGKFLVGVSSTSNTDTVGELFVDYEVELMIPQPAKCPSAQINSGGTVSETAIFGDATVINGPMPIKAGGDRITFSGIGDFAVAVRVLRSGGSGIITIGGTATKIGPSDIRNFDGAQRSVIYQAVRVTTPGQDMTFLCPDATSTEAVVNRY